MIYIMWIPGWTGSGSRMDRKWIPGWTGSGSRMDRKWIQDGINWVPEGQKSGLTCTGSLPLMDWEWITEAQDWSWTDTEQEVGHS